MTTPPDLDEILKQVLSDPKILAGIALEGARGYISEYEMAIKETERNVNPLVYLTLAEGSLAAAEKAGLDTTEERLKIKRYREVNE